MQETKRHALATDITKAAFAVLGTRARDVKSTPLIGKGWSADMEHGREPQAGVHTEVLLLNGVKVTITVDVVDYPKRDCNCETCVDQRGATVVRNS